MKKEELPDIVAEALMHLGGSGRLRDVAKYVWENYEGDLRASGWLFYTWQYDIRWAANELRRRGVMKPSTRLEWELA